MQNQAHTNITYIVTQSKVLFQGRGRFLFIKVTSERFIIYLIKKQCEKWEIFIFFKKKRLTLKVALHKKTQIEENPHKSMK